MDSPWRSKKKAIITSDESSFEDETSDESLQQSLHVVSSTDDESPECKTTNEDEQSHFSPKQNILYNEVIIHEKSSDEISFKNDISDNSSFDVPLSVKDVSREESPQKKIFSGNINSKNLTPERQKELQNAKKFYELELMKEKATLESLKNTVKNVQINTLPDKGAKLRSSIEKQITKVKELNEQLSFVSLNIVGENSQTTSDIKEIKLPNIVDLTKDHMDLSEMGKRALATHQAQQSQTVETLERLHKFLRTSETEQQVSDPVSLKVSLLPHQKTGLTWLLRRESEVPCGGILADDMGLGKTLTVISLILKDMENEERFTKNDSSGDEDDEAFIGRKKLSKGKSLIVCPSSVIGQWSSEVSSKVRAGTLSVYTHHGTKRETNPRNLARYDMVVTTYSILQHENKETPGPLLNIHWRRVVLDEAHVIRNYKCKTAQAAFALRAKRRWALTGTPIHNKQEDYFSLLKFLKCKPFDDLAIWKKMVDNRGSYGMQRLHLLTKSLLLRRTKEDIQKEGGLKELRPKEFSLIEITLDPEEYKIYEKISHFSSALLAQYIHEKAEKENLLSEGINIKGQKNPFEDHPELSRLYNQMMKLKGGVKTHHILVLLLRLRQICCHPSLVTSFIDNEDFAINGIEDNDGNDLGLIDQMMNLSLIPNSDFSEEQKKFISSDNPVFRKDRCSSKIREVINTITEILEKGDDKIIIVSQWTSVLNIIKSFLTNKHIKSVSLNGSVPVKLRIGIIDDFNKNNHGPKVLLLSLTAGGTGLNLVGANHLILVDNHWNPQLEAQACDRIYRVGQTKTVHIYKFVCINTIEERIVKLQKQKIEIAKGVLAGSSKIQAAKLSLHDLKLLFNI